MTAVTTNEVVSPNSSGCRAVGSFVGQLGQIGHGRVNLATNIEDSGRATRMDVAVPVEKIGVRQMAERGLR